MRQALGVGPGTLGFILLSASVGSLLALPISGGLVQRFGAHRVVIAAAAVEGLGLLLLAIGGGALETAPLVVLGLFLMGLGAGNWDVAMNVEGAEVERLMGRSVMPRFHASFSLGTVAEPRWAPLSRTPASGSWRTSRWSPSSSPVSVPCRSRASSRSLRPRSSTRPPGR